MLVVSENLLAMMFLQSFAFSSAFVPLRSQPSFLKLLSQCFHTWQKEVQRVRLFLRAGSVAQPRTFQPVEEADLDTGS